MLLDSWAGGLAREVARATVQPGDRIWVEAADAAALAWVGVGLDRGAEVLLAPPDWTPGWVESGKQAFRPNVEVYGSGSVQRHGDGGGPGTEGKLVLASGGTGGRLALVEHDASTLGAAAEGFARWWGGPVSAVGVLPLWHVSGLMPVVRAALSGGDWTEADYRELGPGCGQAAEGCMVSLVPTQLARLLDSPAMAAWLARTRLVLVGGAATDPELRTRALRAGLPLALSYGMTETAAAVAIAGPGDAAGAGEPAATVLPHAGATILAGEAEAGAQGRIVIAGNSVARRRWTEAAGWEALPAGGPAGGRRWLTGDRGSLDSEGRLRIHGRVDGLINSGGEKVDPEVVMAAIRATGLVDDVWVTGESDPDWGECVTAWIVGCNPEAGPEQLAEVLRGKLPPAARPRRWRLISRLPRTAAGKVDAARLREAQ